MSEENPYIDTLETAEELLFSEIDETKNLLGNRWLERGTFATLIGSSGIGKSVAAMQSAILVAAGLPVFGIKPPRP
jgi:RecA-family ATPase